MSLPNGRPLDARPDQALGWLPHGTRLFPYWRNMRSWNASAPPSSMLGPSSTPAVQVRAEAAAVFPGGNVEAAPSREAVDGMEYCLAVLKEALRKYSVVPVVTRNLNAVGTGGAAPARAGVPRHAARQVVQLACPPPLLPAGCPPAPPLPASRRTTRCWGTASRAAPG